MAHMCLHGYRRDVAGERTLGGPLLRVLDYEGVEVLCSKEHWESKIESNHPELAGRERDVAGAIEHPAMVLQDRDHPRRKHHMVRTQTGHWLKVVVDYESDSSSGAERGSVLTAFLHRRLRPGDAVLYSRSED